MKTLSKIVIVGLVIATGISAAVAESTLSRAEGFAPGASAQQNYTVIHKTDGVWPLKGMISVEPCAIRKCVEA